MPTPSATPPGAQATGTQTCCGVVGDGQRPGSYTGTGWQSVRPERLREDGLGLAL